MWSFLLVVRRHSDSERESSSTAEKCPGGEQRTGHWACIYATASIILTAVFRCFTHASMPEPSHKQPSISADGIVLHDVHSSADEFSAVHFSVVVLLTRMGSHGR